ncbi:hypothetical protein [Flexithrix dorotheae]|uniref:hypothetical protein n=1 Tax=Flexithrix dorotheae TaxID=70993 RepID=UPI00037F2C01|nr:hypothetical protein [Flexithrix dorotheae]
MEEKPNLTTEILKFTARLVENLEHAIAKMARRQKRDLELKKIEEKLKDDLAIKKEDLHLKYLILMPTKEAFLRVDDLIDYLLIIRERRIKLRNSKEITDFIDYLIDYLRSYQ